jgi:hypothetical protein
MSEADIIETKGWETGHVMKSVYRHLMADKEERIKDGQKDVSLAKYSLVETGYKKLQTLGFTKTLHLQSA